MGTAIGRAVDYLVAQVTALPELSAKPVSDGFPTTLGDVRVDIGVSNEDGASEFDIDWAGLGAGRENEQFEIPCFIESYVGGTNQKAARDNAIVVLDAINAKVRSDRSLGGALGPPGVAAIRGVRLVQTFTRDEAGDGRYARIYFNVRCTSRF